MHLAGEEFWLQRLHTFHASSHPRAIAEEDQCQEQAKELKILMLASQKGLNWGALDPQLALALARATRDTLMAEEETAKLKIVECENLLATLKDTLDDACARVEDAHQQIASIISFFDQQGIQINLHPLHFKALQDYLLSSNMHSISEHSQSDSDNESFPDEELWCTYDGLYFFICCNFMYVCLKSLVCQSQFQMFVDRLSTASATISFSSVDTCQRAP